MSKEFNNRTQFNNENAIQELAKTTFPMPLKAILYQITTPEFCRKVVDCISNDYGIAEVDSAFMYPVISKNGHVEDFNMVLYFMCDQNAVSITRMNGGGGNNQQRRGGGSVDLRSYLGQKSVSGGFRTTDDFKRTIAPLAVLDNNGNIVIKGDPDDRRIAIVDVDFWKIMALALGIDSKSNYDFTISNCTPLNNRPNCIDYMLEISKEIDIRERRSRKSKINYEDRNKRLMNRRNY